MLNLPARDDSLRTARVGGAALGLRSGLSFAEIDELRTVLDGAMALLVNSTGRETINLTFGIEPESLHILLVREGVDCWPDQALADFTNQCQPLVSVMETAPGHIRVRKERASVAV